MRKKGGGGLFDAVQLGKRREEDEKAAEWGRLSLPSSSISPSLNPESGVPAALYLSIWGPYGGRRRGMK